MTRLKARFGLGFSRGSEDAGYSRGAKWRVDGPMDRMLCKTLPPPGSQLPSPGFRFAGTDGCLAWSGAPPTTMGRCDISRDGLCLRRRRCLVPSIWGIPTKAPQEGRDAVECAGDEARMGQGHSEGGYLSTDGTVWGTAATAYAVDFSAESGGLAMLLAFRLRDPPIGTLRGRPGV